MKIVSINIEIDRHKNTVNALIEKEKPDVICFQELLEEEFEYFKNTYNKQGVFIPTVYLYHDSQGGVQNRRYGLGIFADNIMKTGYSYYVGSEAHISQSYEEYFSDKPVVQDRGLLWADISIDGTVYRIVTTHFTLTKEGESTSYQLETLGSLFTELDKLGEFVLVGDMNAPRGFETWSRLASRYTDNIPEHYMTSLDQDLHRVKGLMYVVDGLFTTKGYKAMDVALVDGISDHMAVLGEVTKKDI
jgi:endonuclease/exonuclease/phosphatase family metal-dependent hydrolase